MKQNRRKSERYCVSRYFKRTKVGHHPVFFAVYNRVTDEQVGHISDLSTTGIKIISGNSCEKGQLLKLTIELPQPIEGNGKVTVNARCAWCREDAGTGHYSIGIEFLTIMPNHEEIIKQVCDELKNSPATEEPIFYLTRIE
jgi:c-di-GMP-binding flagellar brake protein YcgR